MTSLPLTIDAPGDRPPGVAIQLVDPPPELRPARVDVAAFVCVTERGPLDTPVRLGSWAQYEQVFGTFVPNGLGAYAVKGFFEQGGQVCWVVRVAAPERTTTAVPPQPLDRTRTVVASTSGFVVGAAATVRQGEAVHTYLVTAVDPGTSTLVWDRPLHPSLMTATPLEVATGAGAAGAVLRDAASTPSLALRAASTGSWGNAVEVVATPGTRVVTTARAETGVPLMTPVTTTAGLTVGDTIRVSQETGGTVITGTVVLTGVDGGERLLTWLPPGLPAGLDLSAPFSLETVTTSLTVLERGAVVEVWPDLAWRPEHPRFAPTAVASSRRLVVEVVGTQPPADARVRLRGGRDGTAALMIADLLGDELLAEDAAQHGAATLVRVEEPAVLAIPDLMGCPTPPVVHAPPPPVDPCDPCAHPETVPDDAGADAVVVDAGAVLGYEEIVASQRRLVEVCERDGERIVLLDPPTSAGPSALQDLRSWAARFSSSYAVAVAPWLTVLDPRAARRVRRVPACGHLAGMIARCDTEAGPWLAPANRTLEWAHGVDVELTDLEHAIANTDGVLVIRALPGRGVVPMGARTLSVDPLWVFLPVRRTMIALRRALRRHLAWAVFEPCDRALATAVAQSIGTLMEELWFAGALGGASAAESFTLRTDLDRAARGELLIELGVALARPAELVTLRVSRTDNRLDVSEQPERVTAGGVR